jgi:hypothetical protein
MVCVGEDLNTDKHGTSKKLLSYNTDQLWVFLTYICFTKATFCILFTRNSSGSQIWSFIKDG